MDSQTIRPPLSLTFENRTNQSSSMINDYDFSWVNSMFGDGEGDVFDAGFANNTEDQPSEPCANEECSYNQGDQGQVDFPYAADPILEFVNSRGMQTMIRGGRRIFGPAVNYSGPVPPKDAEIFFSKVPADAFEPELVPIFEQFGNIYQLRLVMDYRGRSRRFGFVQFFNQEDANNAILYLNRYEIRPGFPMTISKSVENNTLCLGKILNWKTRDEIIEEITGLTEGVTQVMVYCQDNNPRLNRGFAFVEYETHRAAVVARGRISRLDFRMWGRPVTVGWANVEPEYLVLRVKNMSAETTGDDLAKMFNENCNNGVTWISRTRDHAYIRFASFEQAKMARFKLHNATVHGSVIEVSVAKKKGWLPPTVAFQEQFDGQPQPVPTNFASTANSSVLFVQRDDFQTLNPHKGFLPLPPAPFAPLLPLPTVIITAPYNLCCPCPALIHHQIFVLPPISNLTPFYAPN